jgi:hypothetical protein
MSPEEITSVGRRFLRSMEKRHMDFLKLPPTLAMVTGRTGGDHIRPDVLATKVFRPNMVHGQLAGMTPAILADVPVTAKDFAACQFYLQARSVNHHFKANDGGDWNSLSDSLYIAATIHDQIRFSYEDQAHRTAGVTDIDGFKIRV